MKRIYGIAFAIMLLGVAVVLLQHITGHDSVYALFLAIITFFRRAAFSMIVSRVRLILFGFLVVVFIPILSRRRVKRRLRILRLRFLRHSGRILERLKLAWKMTPTWIQAIAIMSVAMMSGSTLFIIAGLPFIAKTAAGIFVVRFLADTAAARGIKELVPHAWRFVPMSIREWMRHRYIRLWWRTTRRAIRTGKARERIRMERREKRKPKDSSPT